jgi:polyisoprenoid-binding protein YceI
MFNRSTVAIIALIAFAIGAVVGVLGYNAMTAGSGEASISSTDKAATVAAQTQPTTSVTSVPATTVPATQVATVEAQSAPAETAEATSTIEATTESAAALTDAPAVALASSAAVYTIDSAQSEARFTLQEDLRGSRVDVIGKTKDVGGTINIDAAQPQNSTVNPIVINARTLATDIDFRNQAIRSRILRSADDAYEFIIFTPTAITGLPTTAITDGPVTFQVTGDLKIVETTKSVTFDVTISDVSETEISGTGKTVINWADFNLSIPSAPGVANITPEVTLEIDFVATAAS